MQSGKWIRHKGAGEHASLEPSWKVWSGRCDATLQPNLLRQPMRLAAEGIPSTILCGAYCSPCPWDFDMTPDWLEMMCEGMIEKLLEWEQFESLTVPAMVLQMMSMRKIGGPPSAGAWKKHRPEALMRTWSPWCVCEADFYCPSRCPDWDKELFASLSRAWGRKARD